MENTKSTKQLSNNISLEDIKKGIQEFIGELQGSI